jgi:DNA polymerase IV (DinB-like DNA polymerase)
MAMQSRVVMLMDLDYFYAQCEEKRNPAIKDKPVVVCMFSGRSEDSGAVATANYVARKYGVKSGIPIFMAKKKLEGVDSVFLPADFTLYEQVSDNVMSILKEYADSFEQVGIDEAFLDVSQRVDGDFESARELASKIKSDLKTREGLSGSIGVGPNKLVAKIASDVQKPDGLTVVKPGEVEGFLEPLPVDRLIGVGRKTVERMQALDVKTVGDLRGFDVQRLVEVFGRSLGVYFHNAAAGIDDSPVEQRGEAESFSRIATLKEDTRDLNMILEKTNALCEDVHATLTMHGYSYRTAGIYVVLTNMTAHSRSKTFEAPTDDLATFKETVKELFDKLLTETEFKVRRVGVKAAGLVRAEKGQKALTDFIE